MKKVFVLSLPGAENKLMVADNQEDAFERRGEVEPSYEYLPVQVHELTIEGYDIQAKPKKEEKPAEAEPQAPDIPVEKPPEQPKQKKKPSKK